MPAIPPIGQEPWRCTVLLRCPRCHQVGNHSRTDVLGRWVICPACKVFFSWREAQGEVAGAEVEESPVHLRVFFSWGEAQVEVAGAEVEESTIHLRESQ